MKTILFLYTEIAEYFLACVEELCSEGYSVHIVRFPVNKEAPFKFREIENLKMYERNTFSEQELIQLSQNINPDLLIVSGWIDKTYLKIAKIMRPKIPTVISIDNHWNGTIKQQVAQIFGRAFLKNKFQYAWVPGSPQKKYAQKLGFDQAHIFTGYYSADYSLYNSFFEENLETKKKYFPKQFLFVGRYIRQKGIFDLWNAFIEIQSEYPNSWKLVCVGTGDLFEERIQHPAIKHLGFLQPTELREVIQETGVFVLPSHFEPWGVVVHEFAAAGFPLICSDAVGASEVFVKQGINSFIYKAGNKDELKKSFLKIIQMSESQLIEMSHKSNEFSAAISPKTWTANVKKILLQQQNTKTST